MNSNFPKCPQCNGRMQIKRAMGVRSFVCKNEFSINNYCSETIPIKEGEILSINIIAKDLAHCRFWNESSERGKKQATLRKLAGGLRTQQSEIIYLSDKETQILKEAEAILERIATANEQAKKELKRIEKEEELRRLNNQKLAKAAVLEYFPPERLGSYENRLLFCLVVTGEIERLSLSYVIDDIQDDINRFNQESNDAVALERMDNRLSRLEDDARDLIVGHAYARNDPASYVKELASHYPDYMQQYKSRCSVLIDGLEQFITLRKSNKVVTFVPRKNRG